jgi:hypothetical protein
MWPHSYRWVLCVSLLAQPSAYAACDVSEKALIGAWQSKHEQGFFEVFELHANHRFDSWLHDRPELMGAKWQFVNCQLTINAGSNNIFEYTVKLNRLQLILKDIEQPQGVDGVYERIKE